MPGAMPGHFMKGYILRALDKALADTKPGGKRERLLTGIGARDATGKWKHSLVEVAKPLLPLRSVDEKHLKKHWFDLAYGWWPTQQPVEIVLRHGLIQAIHLAGPSGPNGQLTPISCYWICGLPSFQVVSLVTKAQVTLQILTPGVPMSDRVPADYEDANQLEDIYTVRHRSRGPGEEQVQLDEDCVEFVRAKTE